MLLTATALVLGFMHGLGADHLTAIAALSIGSRAPSSRLCDDPTRSWDDPLGSFRGSHPFRVAVRFAFGHAAHTPVSIALGAVFAISSLRALVLLAPFGLGSSPSGQGLNAVGLGFYWVSLRS